MGMHDIKQKSSIRRIQVGVSLHETVYMAEEHAGLCINCMCIVLHTYPRPTF